jgi:hypothetical protein
MRCQARFQVTALVRIGVAAIALASVGLLACPAIALADSGLPPNFAKMANWGGGGPIVIGLAIIVVASTAAAMFGLWRMARSTAKLESSAADDGPAGSQS